MKLDTQDLMKEFYEKNQHRYPDMTFEEMREICYTQFSYVKQEMESGELPTIRLKYLGIFIVFEGTAKGMLRKMKVRFDNLDIDTKFYFTKKAMLDKFLLKKEQENECKTTGDAEIGREEL